jgi:hypothetical protein
LSSSQGELSQNLGFQGFFKDPNIWSALKALQRLVLGFQGFFKDLHIWSAFKALQRLVRTLRELSKHSRDL